ncbi:hypothetical protein F6X37_35205 [Paraburkholderia sp. 31.1]|uniref:hypothetical protein n=1 Tax=Paraburkholderia sp. 31.1 TaxID=2615205 RepID=UPI0016561379|nr:hypothetical protein [Paraburkholderia sp. 31.1]MBC8726565.1 hypothetical protein [Paraburkholderia sp. 31.1]
MLLIREPTARDGAWLEVAVDYEWERGVAYITHVSLKLYVGPAPASSALQFRAEWDPRSEASSHAQPHWNIDAGRPGTPERVDVTGAAPWVAQPATAPWAAATETPTADNERDLSHFHFAMSATWQHAQGHHSGQIEDEKSLVNWISGCVAYIKAQLAHRRSA